MHRDLLVTAGYENEFAFFRDVRDQQLRFDQFEKSPEAGDLLEYQESEGTTIKVF